MYLDLVGEDSAQSLPRLVLSTDFDTFSLSVKPMAPVIYNSKVTGSSTILVNWRAVTRVPNNAPIQSYILLFNADHQKSQRSINVTAKKNITASYEYELTGLNQITAYSISVSARNKYGVGAASEPVIEKTEAIGEEKRIAIIAGYTTAIR